MTDFIETLTKILLYNNVINKNDTLEEIGRNTFRSNGKTIKAVNVNTKGLFHIKFKLV